MLGNHFLLMWARLSRGLAHISSVAACIQTPVVWRAPADRRLVSTGFPHFLARRDAPLTWEAHLDTPPVPLEVDQGCAASLGVTLGRAYHRNSGLAALARAGVGEPAE